MDLIIYITEVRKAWRIINYLFFTLLFFSSFNNIKGQDAEFIKGADVSFLKQVEDGGGVFLENGIEKDPLLIMKENGFNYIRLRLWHSPADGINGLPETIETAKRIKSLNYNFLLDIHYSDTWADPAHQSKPEAWQNLEFAALKDSVYNYTKFIIEELKQADALPDMVQIGNEIICGMLWNDGNVCGDYNTDTQWSKLAELLSSAKSGIFDELPPDNNIKIMIHLDRGGDNSGARWFFDNLAKQDFSFDIIGLSYYPWWHGTLDDLSSNLNDLAVRYNKDIIVVETSYPFTIGWNDNTNNLVGMESQLLDGYPATVDGQSAFFKKEMEIIQSVPDGKGKGLFLWEPLDISADNWGSAMENQALFGFDGEVLNSIKVFADTSTGIKEHALIADEIQLYQNYPNPFNPSTVIQYSLPVRQAGIHAVDALSSVEAQKMQNISITVYNILGRKVTTLVNENKPAGNYEVIFDASGLSSGVYFIRLQSAGQVKTVPALLLK